MTVYQLRVTHKRNDNIHICVERIDVLTLPSSSLIHELEDGTEYTDVFNTRREAIDWLSACIRKGAENNEFYEHIAVDRDYYPDK